MGTNMHNIFLCIDIYISDEVETLTFASNPMFSGFYIVLKKRGEWGGEKFKHEEP